MTPHQALKNYFGYNEFRPGQLEIINSITAGNENVVILPTGGGKSLCFQIPALLSERYSIVISPLIALMKDQVDSLNKTQRIAACINSSVSWAESEEVFHEIYADRIKLLYLAPERLENLSFAEKIKNFPPAYLFIDEAHCISEWGHNFRPSYLKINEFADFIGVHKKSAFTATATPEVVKDICAQLELKDPKIFIKGFERSNLNIRVVRTKNKNESCLNILSHYSTPAIIYTSSRKKAEELSEYLRLYKYKASYYHAGMHAEERKYVQDLFAKDKLSVIVATTAFGMGIDKADIRLVIHCNMPGTIEGYYQEIGRAGRDGSESHAVMLYDDSDKIIHKFFIQNSYPDRELITGIYNAVCDYGQIALGQSSLKEIPLDMKYISRYINKEINSSLLSASVSILENAGYLKSVSELEKKYYVKSSIDQHRLKAYLKNLPDNEIKDLLLLLVREYGNNFFTGKIAITPSALAATFGFTESYTDNLLTQLGSSGILEYTKPVQGKSVLLSGTRVTTENLFINYKKVADSYLNALDKLDKVIEYVYTSECRMRFIINYFGESEAGYKCGKCDICLSDASPSSASVEYISELVKRTIDENRGPVSDKELISILLGNSTKFYSTAGACANYSADELRYSVENLISREIIKRTGNMLSYDGAPQNGPDLFEAGKTFDYEDTLGLFNKLREVRTKAAKRFVQSPYLICADEVMRSIAEAKPQTEDQMIKIKGVSQRMFNKIGEEFLEIIRQHVEETSKVKTEKPLPSNIQETFELLKKGHSLQGIAALRKLSPTVISMQIETILEYKPDTDISNLFSEEDIALVMAEIESGFIDLKELKSRLPNTIDYPLIRILLAKHKSPKQL